MAQAPDPFTQLRDAAQRFSVGMEIVAEADRAAKLHDNSHLIDGTGRGAGRDVVYDLMAWYQHENPSGSISMADHARNRCQAASGKPSDSWERVLTEEIFEAIEEEPGTQALRAELVQSAAVLLNWIRSIDDRTEEIDEIGVPEGTTVEVFGDRIEGIG